MLPIFLFVFLSSSSSSIPWVFAPRGPASFVKEMRMEGVRGRGSDAGAAGRAPPAPSLSCAWLQRIQTHLLTCWRAATAFVRARAAPSACGEAGPELKVVSIKRWWSQEKQESIQQHQRASSQQTPGAGGCLNKYKGKLARWLLAEQGLGL